MDAKPQRALRQQASLSQFSNENVVPAMFAHQRHKSIGAPILKDIGNGTRVTAKRAAFGDVSNVLRLFPDTASYGFKAHANAPNIVSIPPTAYGKENPVPTAAFLVPAQRPKNGASVSTSSAIASAALAEAKANQVLPAHTGKTHTGVARKTTTVVGGKEVSFAQAFLQPSVAAIIDDVSAPALLRDFHSQNIVKKSPRHYKSQPCLKNADSLKQQEQKQLLRRTQSRLPVDRPVIKDVAVLADDNASLLPEFPEVPTAKDTNDDKKASDADAPEDAAGHRALPPLPDNGNTSMAEIQEDVVQAIQEVSVEAPRDHARFAVEETEEAGFLAEIPAAAAVAASEAEEPWDEDADFYDDQGYTTAHSFRSLGDNTTGGVTTIVMPKMTAKIQNELDIARAIVESSISAEDIEDEAWDISMVAEYGEDIYGYMKDLEAKMLPNPHYMDMQTEIQWSMRAVLMEWLIQVHARFNLLPETLFLTVNYIDRFLSSKIVSVNKLQLVGATAIFIASKYEEITCPSIQEIVYMVDGGYTTDEILKAERFMLSMLGFELGWPGPMSFLRRISKADEYDLETRTLAKYFLEVTVMDERFVACPPSFLAAGAHCLARLMLRKGDWSMAHAHYSGYTWSQVRPLANVILHCCQDPRTHHAAVFEKYASSKFKKASIFVEEEVLRRFSMPFHQTHQHPRHQVSIGESLSESILDNGVVLHSHMDLLVQTES